MNVVTYQPDAQDILIDDSKVDGRKGMIIAGFFFIGLLGWAAMTPLDAGAYAEGVIAVSGKRQVVQHKDGGIVNAIRIQEGQTVTKGQVLFEISASELRANERAVAGEVIALLAQRARLIAESTGASHYRVPAEFASFPKEDQALVEEASTAQRLIFETRRRSITTQKHVLHQRELQLSQQIAGVERQITANREQSRLIGDELQGMREIAKKGFASLNRVRALERGAAVLEGEYGSSAANIAGTHEAIGQARIEAVSLDRQLIESAATQLGDVRVRLDELQPKLAALREQMARATVRAPASGRVVGLSIFTVGAVVAPGEKLMEVVPQDRDLVIEAKVAPTDADDLRIGQLTQVKFSALHERNLPLLDGKITKLSADSFTDERTDQRFFSVEISVPESELEKVREVRGENTGLQAGLPVEVMVPLRKRTALAYLLEPLTQTLWRAGREH